MCAKEVSSGIGHLVSLSHHNRLYEPFHAGLKAWLACWTAMIGVTSFGGRGGDYRAKNNKCHTCHKGSVQYTM
ncbi:hypothetical protein FKM82_021412 [Ascaphus truei]